MSVITMVPSQESGNVYTVLLYRSLESVGIRYRELPYSVAHLLRSKPESRFHYLHFHWPEIFFSIRPRQPLRLFGLKDYLRLEVFWLLAKLRGYKIVWTVHEVDAHDDESRSWLQTLSRRILWNLSDLVFAHSQDVLHEAARRWGQKPHAYLIPHGSYDGAYPDEMSRQQARERLGIPQDEVAFVFLGNVRPYKGLDTLIDAFRSLQADYAATHLIIAGRTHTREYEAEVRSRVAGLPNVKLHLDFVPDENIQVYLRAADCFIAPYRQVETCGVLHLAMAFELPIIIKCEGNVREFASQRIGILMQDSSETEAAMRSFLEMSVEERAELRAQTREASRRYSWESLRNQYRAIFDRFEGRNLL